MNPHNWQSFGDFAADAGLGALLASVAIGLCAWVANRR